MIPRHISREWALTIGVILGFIVGSSLTGYIALQMMQKH
jgi:hypothetical protein